MVSIELENKKSEANNARFMIHALQMVPEQNCKAVEFQKFIELHEKSHLPLAFAVKVTRSLQLLFTDLFIANFRVVEFLNYVWPSGGLAWGQCKSLTQ